MNRDEYERMFRMEDRHWWFLARRDLLMRALRQLPPRKASGHATRILDMGCGTGGTIERLLPLGATVVGLDVEPLALAFCRSRGHVRLALGEATALPFRDHLFDAVIALDVLEHIEDDAASCREMARVLAPGGLLYVSVPAYRSLWSTHDIALMHQRRYVRREIRNLLQETAGLRIERLTYIVSALLPIAWLIRSGRRLLRPNAPAYADTFLPRAESVNRLLRTGLDWEAGFALRFPIPFGLSLFAVARKPEVI